MSLQPQDHVVGLAKKAAAVFVAYDEAREFMDDKAHIISAGNPVVIPETKPDKNQACQELGLKVDLKTVLIFGGSQGAATINHAVKKWLATELDKEVQILWQCGAGQYKEYKKMLDENPIKNGSFN